MAVRKTESRIPGQDGPLGSFTNSAELLGDSVSNTAETYALVSYLMQPIRYDETKKHINNTYVVFDKSGISDPATYKWTIEFYVEGESNPIAFSNISGVAGGAVLKLNTNDSTFGDELEGKTIIRVDISVSIEDGSVATTSTGTSTTTLVLQQDVSGLIPAVESLIKNDDNEQGANAGEPNTTRLLANDYNNLMVELGVIPLNLLFTLMYQAKENAPGLLSSALFDSDEEKWANYINGVGNINYSDLIDTKIGCLDVKPHVAYFLIKVSSGVASVFDPAIESLEKFEDRLLASLDGLDQNERIDLFNNIRFPKSCMNLVWEALFRIKERRTNFQSIVLDATNHPDNKEYIGTIVTEYETAPQDNLDKFTSTSLQAYDIMHSQWMQAIIGEDYFDFSVELISDDSYGILTPYRVFDFNELKNSPAVTRNKSKIKFALQILHKNVDSLEFIITTGSGSSLIELYREVADPALINIGSHDWFWDGMDNNRILDTRVLKDPSLTLTLRAKLDGVIKERKIKFENNEAEVNWVDVEINELLHEIYVYLRVNIQEGGEEGVGELPPASATTQPPISSLPASDSRSQPHARVHNFSALRSLVLDGINQYWSRNLVNGKDINVNGVKYTVDVTAQNTSTNAMDDISVDYRATKEIGMFDRSSNPGSVDSFISFLFNVAPERIIYLVGWLGFDTAGGVIWSYTTTADADDEFKRIAAHEIGHEILKKYGTTTYSYGHKDSSSITGGQGTNTPIINITTWPSYNNELDLMRYYNIDASSGWTIPPPSNSNYVASEQDVKSLLWLSRVEFGVS